MAENNTKTFYHDCGKGDRPRGTGWANYYSNWDAIFAKKDEQAPKTCIKCPRDVDMRCDYCGLRQSDGTVKSMFAATSSDGQEAIVG